MKTDLQGDVPRASEQGSSNPTAAERQNHVGPGFGEMTNGREATGGEQTQRAAVSHAIRNRRR